MAVMRNVGIGHQNIAVTDVGNPTAAFGAAIDGRELANGVVIADLNTGRLSVVLEVLGFGTERGELRNPVVTTERNRSLDHAVGSNRRPRTDPRSGVDDRIRANDDAGV